MLLPEREGDGEREGRDREMWGGEDGDEEREEREEREDWDGGGPAEGGTNI